MGIKLKSLRPAVGTYGTVAANGIIEVDASRAEELIKTGRFVKATAADVKAAQARQEEMLADIPGPTVWAQVLVAGDDPAADADDDQDPDTDNVSAPADTESPAKQKRRKGSAKVAAGDDEPADNGPVPAVDGEGQ